MVKSKGLTDMSQATSWWLPSITGIFLGFVFFVLTFTPSLVPRPPVVQGLLGGLAFFIGYVMGLVVCCSGASASKAPSDWGRVRIVYIVYPSDAIVFFEESMFFRQPQWMVAPRGEDVSPLLQWFPIITALQVGIDMMFAAAVPPGHGHDYAVVDYIEAWTAVTVPQDWTGEDAGRLATELEAKAARH